MVWVFCFIGIIAFALEYSTIFSLEKVSWQMILYEMCQLSCPVLTISCFFSGSSALSPAFLPSDAHDFLLFLWFVRCIQKQEKIPAELTTGIDKFLYDYLLTY